MAVGDDATNQGYPLVPDSGENGRVRWGAREINRTRDFVAQVKSTVPVGYAEYREASRISWGVAAPSGGLHGDIYFRLIT